MFIAGPRCCRTGRCTWVVELIDGWMDGQTDGRMDGQADRVAERRLLYEQQTLGPFELCGLSFMVLVRAMSVYLPAQGIWDGWSG